MKTSIYQDQDTIVCNQKVDDEIKGIGYFTPGPGAESYVQADSDLTGIR